MTFAIAQQTTPKTLWSVKGPVREKLHKGPQ